MSETKFVPFAEAFKDKTGKNPKVPKGEYEEAGEIPVVDQGKNFIAGYTSTKNQVLSTELPTIVFGDHTRAVKFVDFPFALGADGVKVLEPQAGFIPKYLYWKLKETHIPDAGYSRHFKFLKEANFPQPSIEEQEKYVLQRDLQELIEQKRARQRELLSELEKSVFIDIFGAPENWSMNYEMTTIGELAESTQYGTSAKSGDSGKYPVLRMGNIADDGKIDLSDLKYADFTESEIPKYTVRKGDLLFNRTNSKEKVGKCAVVETDQKLAFAGYLVRVRFTNPDYAYFVSAYLNSDYGKKLRQKMAKAAVNQANINATELKNLKVPNIEECLQEYANIVKFINNKKPLEKCIFKC